jgi:hypothetical protein
VPKVAGSAATLGISLESSGKPKTFEPENLSDYVKDDSE